MTATEFWSGVLQQIGAPVTQNNIEILNTWSVREGTKATWNPLATTQREPGSTSFNSVGVQNFPDANTGINATAKTLQNGYYPNIITALRNNTPINVWQSGGGGIAQNLQTWSGVSYTHIGTPNPSYVSPAFGAGTVAGSGPLPSVTQTQTTVTSGQYCLGLGTIYTAGGGSGVAGATSAFFSWIGQSCLKYKILLSLTAVGLIWYGLKFIGTPIPGPMGVVEAPVKAVRGSGGTKSAPAPSRPSVTASAPPAAKPAAPAAAAPKLSVVDGAAA